MTGDPRNSRPPLEWLVDWLRQADSHAQCHSLVLSATSGSAPQDVACAVAAYLNEFDGHGGSHWRTFDSTLLRQLAGDPVSRALVLSSTSENREESQESEETLNLGRIARHLAALGGVILVGRRGSEATSDLETTFHVYLCRDKPPAHRKCHMWVNPARFSPESLVSVIADSFLDWTCQSGAPSPAPLRDDEDPAALRQGR